MFRISVKRLLCISGILFLITAIGFWIYRSESQRASVDEVIKHGGIVRYDFQLNDDLSLSYQKAPFLIPSWCFNLLGADYFAEVAEINLSIKDSYSEDVPFDLSAVSKLPKTKILRIDIDFVENADSLAKLTNLRALELPVWFDGMDSVYSKRDTKATLKNLNFLKKLHRLERVKLPSSVGMKGTVFLKNCRHLKHLHIGPWDQIRRNEFLYSSKSEIHPKLIAFALEKTNPFEEESQQKELEELDVQSQIEAIRGFLELESFLFSISSYQSEDIGDVLHGFQDLQKLKNVQIQAATDIDVSVFSSSKQMKTLVLNGTNLSNVKSIKSFLELEELCLIGDSLPLPEEIRFLSNLRELSIREAIYKDIVPISGLKKLEVLRLVYCEIDEFSPLQKLSSLRILDIRDSLVSSVLDIKGLHNLRQIFTSNYYDNDSLLESWDGNHTLFLFEGEEIIEIYPKKKGELQ